MATTDEVSTHEWKPGHRCYLIDGREAEFVSNADRGGFFVRTVTEAEDWDGHRVVGEGQLEVADQIFPRPPVDKVAAEVADLTSKVEALEEKRRALQSEVLKIHSEKVRAEKETADAFEAAKQVPALRSIIDMMTSPPLFAVVEYYHAPLVRVVEGDERVDGRNRTVAELKLDASGKPTLQLWNWAKAARGGWLSDRDNVQAVSLHHTREEAHAEAVRILMAKERSPDWIPSAEALGVPVTVEDRITAHGWHMRGAQSALESQQKALQQARQKFEDRVRELAELEALLPAPPAPKGE